jgi:hypothetical protein
LGKIFQKHPDLLDMAHSLLLLLLLFMTELDNKGKQFFIREQ